MGVSHGYSLLFGHFNHDDFIIPHKCWLPSAKFSSTVTISFIEISTST